MRSASGLGTEPATPGRQEGHALLTVLMTMMILQAIAWAFLYRVNFEQRLSGGSARGLAALYLAEGGLQRALDLLQDRREMDWALPYEEPLGQGTFTIEAMDREPGGLIAIVVRGETGGTHRRVKGLVRAGPRAFGFGLSVRGVFSLDGQSRAYVVPMRIGESRWRRVGDLAAVREVRFEGSQAALNTFDGRRLPLREGLTPDTLLLRPWITADPGGQVDLVLGEGAKLFSGVMHRAVTLEELRRDIRGLGVRNLVIRRPTAWPSIPIERYKALAESNTANAVVNTAVAAWGLAPGLAAKTHSRYTAKEFQAIMGYLSDEPEAALRGVIFVDGNLYVLDRMRLNIVDGALGVNGDITLMEGARLEVRRAAGTRVLPGIVTWNEGDIKMDRNTALVADGLVLADGDILIEGGILDVVGAVLSRDFSTDGAITVVRYDPAVLGTEGLLRVGNGIAELVSWQVLR